MTSFQIDLVPSVWRWWGLVVGVGCLPPGVRSIRRLLLHLLTVGHGVVAYDVLLPGRVVLLVIIVLGSISGINFNRDWIIKLSRIQHINKITSLNLILNWLYLRNNKLLNLYKAGEVLLHAIVDETSCLVCCAYVTMFVKLELQKYLR